MLSQRYTFWCSYEQQLDFCAIAFLINSILLHKNAHDLLGLNYECIILYKEFNGTKSHFIEVITYYWEQY
jgi:hypothetical protein